ncbi:MAG TPA: ComF family protein [Thermodesulfovibrionales bacterium]|nr:ComF family protein [Thermodesulfovibrionales bacterium]
MRRPDLPRGCRLVSAVLSALYPSACPACKNPTDTIAFAPFCRDCWSGITRYTGPSCDLCALPLVSQYATRCGECFSRQPPHSSVLNFGLYSGNLREAISLLKFSRVRRLAKPLGRFLSELAIPHMDGIVPVPLTARALRQRGFNQTLLLARVLSRLTKVPVSMDLLYKKRETLPQIGLGAKERQSNLRGAFKVVGNARGKRLILLDDVMTTGATVRECSKALIRAGAKEVVVVTLARASLE